MEQMDVISTMQRTPLGKIGWLLLSSVLLLSNQTQASEISHGMSFFGDLKYPPNFKHLDYVNPDAPKGGTLRLPNQGSFDTLNSFIRKGRKASGLAGTAVTIYDRLMADVDDEPSSQYGWLADAVELEDDFSRVSFWIRPEARWHDGQPLTVDDVVFSFNQYKRFGSPILKMRYRDVIKVDKSGPRKVTFHIKNATSPKQQVQHND
jgi:microcin C transport system substrate-binding protein